MEFTSNSIEGIQAEAAAKGMFVVNPNNKDSLLDEYDEKVQEADKLIAIVDPDTSPYASKYKAREILDAIVNKLEATKTVAMLEMRKEDVAELNWRIAAAQTKSGVISWEVEEPHNAQTDLERAAQFYAPGFAEEVNKIADFEEEEDKKKDSDSNARVTEIFDDDTSVPNKKTPLSLATPPSVDLPRDTLLLCIDAMKCLNMLGILWAGRGMVQKSFMYLIAANQLYLRGKVHLDKLNANSSAADRRKAKEMESVYTHNLFYLAQSYGHIGDTKKSAAYCFETLQRQYNAGFDSVAGALDWIKNCIGISDFYIALGQYKKCALALLSAQAVLMRRVLSADFSSQSRPDTGAGTVKAGQDTAEVEADLSRRLAHLDMTVMKSAYERKLQKDVAEENGVAYVDTTTAETDDDDGASDRATHRATQNQVDTPPERVEFFKDLHVTPIPYLSVTSINEFADARVVFLRAGMHIDASKKHFVLDGHVSDHTALLQMQSKLYHFVAAFEPDTKRKLAMENKRIELLAPLLKALNRVAFEGLHKSISYELGEVYMTLQEIKIEKLRSRREDKVVNSKTIKTAELDNCNAYAHGSLSMFTHYISFFAQEQDNTARGAVDFSSYSMETLATAATMNPNIATISEDEVRSFLNAHFLCCRMLSKIMLPQTAPPAEQARYMVHCLKRYEWLRKFAPTLCEVKKVDVHAVFGEEWQICKDMSDLLPSKINRIFHMGETPTL